MLRVSHSISIPLHEISLSFVHSSGPGGQNVNKVATACQLRFDVENSPSLPPGVKQRLLRQAARRITTDGVLLIDARRYRSQGRNRDDALERLRELILQAAVQPKKRKATRPTLASKKRRLENKRQRSETKQLRRRPEGD